ncbi:MAG TPA: hypothetical protein VFZ61_09610 [Polyangiales bacterium]
MIALRPWLLALLALPAAFSSAQAHDIQLETPALQLDIAAVSLDSGQPAEGAPASSRLNSAPLPALAAPRFETDPGPRRQLTGAGYGLASGVGLMLGGLVLAAQTRPRHGEFSDGVCYDDRENEKQFLYIGTGVMGAGIALSMGMIAWLVSLRRAHPELRTSARTRGLQALTGIGVAGVTTTLLMGFTIGCSSS